METRLVDEKRGVYLRLMTREDTGLIVSWRNTDRVRSRFLYRGEFTEQTHENWIKTMVETGKVVQMMICKTDSDEAIGSVYLRDIDYQNKKAEYGIFIGSEQACGNGYGSAAAKLMLSYAFETLGLHKIFLRVLADNGRAIGSYENAGFVKEAYLKDEIFLDGEYRDLVFMAILEPTKEAQS